VPSAKPGSPQLPAKIAVARFEMFMKRRHAPFPSTARIPPLHGLKAVAVLFSRAIVMTSMEAYRDEIKKKIRARDVERYVSRSGCNRPLITGGLLNDF
jgi:hypothetical protein